MDWTILPGRQEGTYRLLSTEHGPGAQAADWGLSAWSNNDAKRNDGSSRVAVHAASEWSMDWVLTKVG